MRATIGVDRLAYRQVLYDSSTWSPYRARRQDRAFWSGFFRAGRCLTAENTELLPADGRIVKQNRAWHRIPRLGPSISGYESVSVRNRLSVPENPRSPSIPRRRPGIAQIAGSNWLYRSAMRAMP